MDTFWTWLFTPILPTSPFAILGWLSIGAWGHAGLIKWREHRATARRETSDLR